MKKTLAIIAVVALGFLPGIASAQVSPANFWRKVGDFIQPWDSSIKVKTTELCFGDDTCQTTAGGGGAGTWATTSTDAWLTTKDTDDLTEGATNKWYSNTFVQTLLDATSKGYFFSTTSADVWGGLKGYLTAETDPDWNADKGDYQLTANAWATTSTDFWYSSADRFSTTTSDYWLSTQSNIPLLDAENSFSTGTTTMVNAYVSGNLQVDGIFYAPAEVTVSGNLDMGTNNITNAGTGDFSGLLSVYGDGNFNGGLAVGDGDGNYNYLGDVGGEFILSIPDGAQFEIYNDYEGGSEQIIADFNSTASTIYGDLTIDGGDISASNLSGTNTGDQVADGVTITGAGTAGDPFVAGGGAITPWTSDIQGAGFALLNVASTTVTGDSTIGGKLNNFSLLMSANLTTDNALAIGNTVSVPSGKNSIAIGSNIGGSSGIENVWIVSAHSNPGATSGIGNTVMGARDQSSWSIGSSIARNTIIGGGLQKIKGNDSTLVGYQTGMSSLGTETANTLIGSYAGNSPGSSPTYNTMIGYKAGYSSDTPYDSPTGNVLVGNQTSMPKGATGNEYSYNTILGNLAKVSTASTVQYALSIGASADTRGAYGISLGANTTAVGNSVAIGYHADATVANTMILGDATTNLLDIGIGTSTPTKKLVVSDGATATTTVQFGDVYSGTGKTCFEIAQTDGSIASFYFAGGAMVIETNACVE